MASSDNKHVPALDGIRAWAVLLVFFLHFGGGAQSHFLPLHILGLINKLGWSGVSLFFVLSGFLITGILWDSLAAEHWWRHFYIRRVLRIFPLYYLSLIMVVIAAAVVGHFRQVITHVWVWLLYLQNSLPQQPFQLNSPLPVGHFWSLAVEEQFYLVWPFLLVMARKREKAKSLCFWGIVFSFAYRCVVAHFDFAPLGPISITVERAGEFCSGGWLALAMRGPEREYVLKKSRVGMLLAFCGLAWTLVMTHGPEVHTHAGWMETIGLASFGILFAGLIAESFREGWVRKCAEQRGFVWLGKISYGIYVYHILFTGFYHAAGRFLLPHGGHNAQLFLTLVIAACGTLAISWISFRYFESPFLRLKNKFSIRPERNALPLSNS